MFDYVERNAFSLGNSKQERESKARPLRTAHIFAIVP